MGALFGYIQCENHVLENQRIQFSNFSPIFKNTNVSRQVIGPLIQEYTETEGLMSQQGRTLISRFEIENGTIITQSLLFHLEPGFVCTKIYRFVEYTSVKCFKAFVQSVVDARQQRRENPIFSVVAEKVKFFAHSSFGCQIKDRICHSVKKYLNDDKRQQQSTKKCSGD